MKKKCVPISYNVQYIIANSMQASQTVNQTDRQIKGLRKGYLLNSAFKSPMNIIDNYFFCKIEKQKDR